MTSDPGRAGDSRFDELGDEPTLADEEWPVDAHYVEQPVPGAVQEEFDRIRRGEAGEVVAPSAPSRSGVGAAVLAVLIVALLLLGSAAGWIALGDRGGPSSQRAAESRAPTGNGAGPTTSSTTTQESAGTLAVPEVTGLAVADARELLTAAGFHVTVRDEASDQPRGEVLRQVPDAGEEAERSSVLVLTVSSGSRETSATAEQVSVPSVVGLSASSAVRKLRALDLVPKVSLVTSPKPAGTVLSQGPGADATVPARSIVRLRAARHAEGVRVSVPTLVGLTAASARHRLAAAGLGVSVREGASDETEGTVIAQDPSAGVEVRTQTTVRITVSSGPASVAVPSVVGLDEASARDQLEAAGFVVQTVDQSTTDPSQDGTVKDQEPSGGTHAAKGSTVVLTIARSG
jgi:beta-lactam-binding protein with PASTA domain